MLFDNKIHLPKFTIVKKIHTLSQTMDWGIIQLNVPDTWKHTRGEDITVLVIDTGYTNHQDLSGAMMFEQSKSFIKEEKTISDLNGHSTHVCGVIGARDNEYGIVGVAPRCKIVTYKVLDKWGSGSMEGIENALECALSLRPDIISMSLGSSVGTERMHEAIKILYALDIPIICASGNDGREGVNYPAKYPEVIAVTAFNKDNKPADFNSTGPEVDVSAPGVGIYSTWLNDDYCVLSGTSMACPFVSGIVALLLSKHKKQERETGLNDCKTVLQVIEHLKKYSNRQALTEIDNNIGYGLIDPNRLMEEKTPNISIERPLTTTKKINIWQRLFKVTKRM